MKNYHTKKNMEISFKRRDKKSIYYKLEKENLIYMSLIADTYEQQIY